MTVPIASPVLGPEERERVLEVLEGGRLADGPRVRAFESEFADRCGVDHGVATANGTTALHALLCAIGVGEGDAVLTSPYSFAASANAVRLCGATPVFADVDPSTFDLDPAAAEARIRERDGDVDVILVVHLFGLAAEMDRFQDLAERYDAALVGDAAQAHGARYDGQPVGSFGDAAAFSFYPTKNMTAGEGGMVVTDRADVAERAARFVDHGQAERYHHVEVGHNFRMTSVAAAIGRAQLEKLPGFVERRRENARRITKTLAAVPGVRPPLEPERTRHAYNQYTVRSADRDALADHLSADGVDTRVYYPAPIHRQPAYDGVDDSFPAAERASAEALSLPVHPALSQSDLRTIRTSLENYASDN